MKRNVQRNGKGLKILSAVIILAVVFWLGTLFKSGTQNEHAHGSAPVQSETEKPATVWTCSMHPQFQLPKPGKCPICSMDLIPLTQMEESGGEAHHVRLTMSESAKKVAGIVTAPAVRRGITSDIRLTGKVALDETRVEMITARIAGRIDRLFVDYTGVPVSTGDHLANIYSPELVLLQKELLEAAKARELTQQGTMAQAGIARTFDAAKEKLRLLGFSQRDLEEVLRRGTTTDHMTIRAGQRGVVLKKLVEEGSYVKTGTPLFHIADLRKLWLMLDAYESDLMWLRLGQRVTFSVEAYPGESFDGAISFIDPVVDPMTRTVNVRVIAENRDGRLKPDMFVKARVEAVLSKSGAVKNSALRGKWLCPMHPQVVKNRAGTCNICGMPLVRAEELGYVTSGFEDVDPLVIPATAPLYTGERSLVYVAVPNTSQPTYEARTVELGPQVGGYYIVRSGVAEGEQVVVNGSFRIDAELQIRAKPSMMDPVVDTVGKRVGEMQMEMSTVQAPAAEEVSGMPDAPVAASFLAELGKLYNAYFDVAEALASDSFAVAKRELMKFRKHATSLRAPKGKQYAAWQRGRRAMVADLGHTHHAAGLTDVRTLFDKVSRQMIALEKKYGHASGDSRYLAFCPMAFDNKGAYWLQTKQQIRNPFFGAQMLGCGEIRETFEGSAKELK